MTNHLFRDNMLIIFFIALCSIFSFFSVLRINKLESDIESLKENIDQKQDRILSQIKYLREDYTDQMIDLKHAIFSEIEDTQESLVKHFQHERVQLEDLKSARTKDTFKNLKAAFSPVDVKIEKDEN